MTSTVPLSSTPKNAPSKAPVAVNSSSSRNARTTATPSSPQFSTLLTKTESDGGKRMFRTSDGKTVELPDDMTAEEAAKLESEAKAAQQKLGKGPRPKPIPNVKQAAKKEGKTAKPNPEGKKAGKGKGKAAFKTGAAVSTLLKVGTGKVAQYLVAKGTPALVKGVNRLQMLSRNEQTHDNASEKLNQTEKAVIIPTSEGQSKSNTGQVNLVSAKPAPVADENKAKQKLQESLKENIPKNIEDVDNFKRDMKAQHMGTDVMTVVQGDKNAVVTTFGDMGNTPPPTPPEHAPEALPPEEIAPPTANMDLGQGTIAPLQKEHTDVSNFTKEADGKLKEEGITQEQLDMVDSGDLAVANKEKKGMEIKAKTEPLAVQKLAQQETQKIDRDLKQEEKKERTALKAKRKAGLGATANKQKTAKSALEKKREEIAAKINGIFTKAQNSVKKKLADLEIQSMKRFDDGNAKASKEFEDNVNREIDAFKDDRYSGFFGWARKAKDWLLGMDDLPEVKAIFERNRAAFVTTINKLVEDISADNKRVIQECKDELANAKLEIKDYVDKLGPALKDVGKKAADEMNSKLAEMDQFIAQKEEDLQNKLKDKQQAAIKAIDEKIEKMKEAMSGALAKLGKLLLLAAKKFFTWALEKVGFSLSDIEGIINKGVAVLKAIFTKPIQFVKNLVKAAMTGFENFGKNFLKHLKNALFEWLTGSLEGLVLPSTWDFKGVVSIALQMIGISYQNIRKHMVTVMGEPVVAGLEKTFTLVKTLITEGPMAAWEQLKEMAGEMQQAFIDAVKDFIKTKIIEQAIQWVVSLFIPGAGIVKAIIGIYDTIVFFIQKAKQIMQMIANFLGAVGEIAAGNIGAAADALENGLARGLSLVISFLAQLLHLSGITKKIKDAIQKIRAKVDAVLEKVAKWIADKAKKLFGAVKAGVGKLTDWWKKRKNIEKDGKKITLYTEGNEEQANVLVASSPGVAWSSYLKKLKKSTLTPVQQKAHDRATELAKNIEQRKSPKVPAEKHAQNMEEWFNELADKITILNGDKPRPASVIKYGGVDSQGGGVSAEASILSSDHPQGNAPNDKAPIWENLQDLGLGVGKKGKPIRWTSYVQGHLLNHNLGGPGLRFNLTPITKRANNQHKSIVETTIKDEVNKKNGKIIYYKITALAPPPKGANPRLTELKRIKQSDLTENEKKEKKALESLANLTKGFKCIAYELEQDSEGNWTKKVKLLDKLTTTIDNDIEDGGNTYGY